MKIIITGATGFLGGWLVKHFLEKNIDIIVINNSSRNIKNRVSQYIIKKYSDECNEKFINLMDSDSINNLVKAEKPDAIFHLAAIGDVTVAFDDPKNTFQISSNATLNLLEAIRNESPNTLFVSHTTDKVYSGNPVPFHEGMNLNPEHIYEVAKISQEFLTKIYAKSYNIKTVTLRCGNYFGGFDFNFNRIIPYVIKCALHDKPIILRSNGKFTRDFLYIKDAVLVNELILSKFFSDNISNLSGEAFNFSLEIQMQVIDIVKLILDLCKKKLPIQILGDATNEISDMNLNCSKSKKILNWKPIYSFEKGLEETIDFYRHYLIK